MTATAINPTVDLKHEVLDTAQAMLHSGLVEGTAGNVSARLPDGNIVMTPTSVGYDTMTVEDLVVLGPDGNVVEGTGAPTTEKALHLACYRRYKEVGAVIHTHAQYASMFALVHEPIPAVIEGFVVYVGGDVPIAEYQLTGSDELGEVIASRLDKTSAALMANHGMVAIGSNLHKALHVTELVDRSAKIIWGARVMGTIQPLPEKTSTGLPQRLRVSCVRTTCGEHHRCGVSEASAYVPFSVYVTAPIGDGDFTVTWRSVLRGSPSSTEHHMS